MDELKWPDFIVTKTMIIAIELAYQLVYGLLMDIVSDRDSIFISNFGMKVFKKLETTWSMRSLNHPQSDGYAKRVNKIIADML